MYKKRCATDVNRLGDGRSKVDVHIAVPMN